jgi:hypothetical protein
VTCPGNSALRLLAKPAAPKWIKSFPLGSDKTIHCSVSSQKRTDS